MVGNVKNIYYSKLKSDDIQKIIKDLTELQLQYSTHYNDNDNFMEQFDYIEKAIEKLEDVLFILDLQTSLSKTPISKVDVLYSPRHLMIYKYKKFPERHYKYCDENNDNLKEYLLYKAIKENDLKGYDLDFRFLDGYKEDGLVKEPSIITTTIISMESFTAPSSGNYIRGSVIAIDDDIYLAVTPIHKGDMFSITVSNNSLFGNVSPVYIKEYL